MAFFTKKQKVQMRKRRQKKKKLTSQEEQPAGEPTHDRSARKRKRADVAAAAETTQDDGDDDDDDKTKQHNIITIPPHLTGKEARKFRKDSRRQARTRGRDDTDLVFVVEGQAQKEEVQGENGDDDDDDDDGKDDVPSSKKKRKKTFPRINDILQQQREEQQRQQQEAARREAEERIPEDIKAKYLALDCEMVGIGTGGKQSALARVSLVDWYGTVILDTFVQVPSRVTDFRTFVSGVRAKDIHSRTAMDVVECRKQVADLLKDKILVGHALKNDLQALMLIHPKRDIRDTAKYRPFQRASGPDGGKWRPRKLRDLVKEHLDLTIQQKGEAHDSTEDARATMELFKRVRDAWEKEIDSRAARKQKKKKK